MPNYRRALTPGGTFFFTLNLLDRDGNDLLVRHIDLLRTAVAAERTRRPFAIRGWVVLPEHMHWLWTLTDRDSDFPTRWRRIKTDFSRALPRSEIRGIYPANWGAPPADETVERTTGDLSTVAAR